MKLSCLDQSQTDGDCYILSVANKVILYGSLLRLSSLQRFLPAYFEFFDDRKSGGEGDLSPKTMKRQKQTERITQMNQLLTNNPNSLVELAGCEFPCGCEPGLLPQEINRPAEFIDDDSANSQFYKTIRGEVFADCCQTKFDIRHFNVLDVKDINIVLVSTF